MTENTTIKKIMIATLVLVIIVIIGALTVNHFFKKSHLPQPVAINIIGQPTIGKSTAKIQFVVFEDLKCSNCARFSNDIFPTIKQKYIDTGIATYTMINLAFVPGSLPAANAARCVYMQNPDLFFDYVETIFKNQPPEEENWATIPNLLTIAATVKGIDTNTLAPCLVQSPYNGFIQNNLKMAITLMNHQVATPSLYINGIAVQPLTLKQINTVVNAVK